MWRIDCEIHEVMFGSSILGVYSEGRHEVEFFYFPSVWFSPTNRKKETNGNLQLCAWVYGKDDINTSKNLYMVDCLLSRDFVGTLPFSSIDIPTDAHFVFSMFSGWSNDKKVVAATASQCPRAAWAASGWGRIWSYAGELNWYAMLFGIASSVVT